VGTFSIETVSVDSALGAERGVCSARAACSFANRREKSWTALFSFWREGVVPARVEARRPLMEEVYLIERLRPKGPDSSGWRGFLDELEVC